MKTSFLFLFSLISVFSLHAQDEKNQACYKDTSLVDKNISRADTIYVIREQFRKGDWELFYDFALTKKMGEYHFDKDGNKTGHSMEWYANGKTKADFDYTNSWFNAFPVGTMYFNSGKLQMKRAIQNDSLIETTYFEQGKISRIRKWTRNGLMCVESHWYENGQLQVSYNPTSSTPQHVTKYYASGKTKSEYNWYIYGYSGPYTEYHENGQISIKGQYQEIPTGSSAFMARKTGEWIFYDNKGKVVKSEDWSKK